jgi:hypothetical protein
VPPSGLARRAVRPLGPARRRARPIRPTAAMGSPFVTGRSWPRTALTKAVNI